jgi:hypothetical protein
MVYIEVPFRPSFESEEIYSLSLLSYHPFEMMVYPLLIKLFARAFGELAETHHRCLKQHPELDLVQISISVQVK